MTLSSRALGVASVIVVVSAAPALAQRQDGPFGGVLGGDTTANARQGLTVQGSLFGAWDDVLTDFPPGTAVPGSSGEAPGDDRLLRSGGGAGATAGLTHVWRTPRTEWQSSASTSTRLHGGDNSDIAATFAASTGGSASKPLGRRTSLTASGALAYAPYYSVAPGANLDLSGQSPDMGFALATSAAHNISSSGSLGVGITVSSRDTLNFSARASRYDFLGLEQDEVTSWGGSASYSRPLTRSLSFVAGVAREDVQYEAVGAAPVASTSYTLGLDYADGLTLTFSRRTSVSFSTSSSVVSWNNNTHFRVNGSASLTHALNRTSTASLQYGRSTDFDAGFRAPLLSDSLSGGVSTQLGRRASLSGQASVTGGSVGFGDDAGSFTSYSAGAGVTVAVTRRLGVFGNYTLYRYEVPAGAPAVPFLPAMSRQSVTGGLSVWLPLINDARSSK